MIRCKKAPLSKAPTKQVFIWQVVPGTGKTTVINGIIKTYADLHGLDLKKSDLPIILAPTAACRMRTESHSNSLVPLSIDI